VKVLNSVASLLRAAWVALGVALLIFLMMEMIAAAFVTADGDSIGERGDSRALADSYRGAPWAKKLFEEFARSEMTGWSPYVHFRRRPFEGQYINVDENGVRLTVNNASSESAPKRLFMFGGSTVWGTGARDDFTIPSLLVAELSRRGIEAQITNFGESGYVTTQEVILLLLQLRNGNVPDAVIFYDGVNDLYAAYQSGLAGVPQNETNRVAEFNLSQPGEWRRAARFAATGFARSSAAAKVTRSLLADLGVSQVVTVAETPALRTGSEAGRLAEQVLYRYRGNIGIVNGLAEQFGFKAWFFWQPTIFQKRLLTSYEQNESGKQADLRELIVASADLLRSDQWRGAEVGRFKDLSQVFYDEAAPVFIDWCHVGERGNELVAEAIAEQVLRDGL
jgi:hypothetical protein